MVRLHSVGGGQLLAALEKARSLAGPKNSELPEPDSREEIWFLTPDGTGKHAWRRGAFCVRDGGLSWRGGSGQGLLFRMAASDVLVNGVYR